MYYYYLGTPTSKCLKGPGCGHCGERGPMSITGGCRHWLCKPPSSDCSVSVEKPIFRSQILLDIKEAIQKRSATNAMCVGKATPQSPYLADTRESIRERNPMGAAVVGKPSATSPPSLNIRERIQKRNVSIQSRWKRIL